MSVMEFNKDLNVAIINQKVFLKSVYGNIKEMEDLLETFEIKTPFRMDLEAEKIARSIENPSDSVSKKRRKRKLASVDEILKEEIVYLKEKITGSRQLLEKHFPGQPSLSEIRENNRHTREKVKRLLDTRRGVKGFPPRGVNESEDCLVKDGVLFPPRSSYVKMDISEMSQFRDDFGKFDLILLDPPWENKHIKRHKNEADGYCMLGNKEIIDIPVETFLSDDGLVIVWTTNSPRHRASVHQMFSQWGIVKLATWYWLKVTSYGQLICDFSQGKQPYEICLVGQSERRGEKVSLEDGLVLVSVPSAVNSHKPPLADVLAAVTGGETSVSRKLEIFGRSLSPGWMTVGNEPCLLNVIQNETLADPNK